MIPRYIRPEMGSLWTDLRKIETWTSIELAILDAQVDLGLMDREIPRLIREHYRLDVERWYRIEDLVAHDVNAYVQMIHESLVGTPAESYRGEIHKLVTSFDIVDNAQFILMRQALRLVRDQLQNLLDSLRAQAIRHRTSLQMARSHRRYAQPSTFGHYMLVFYAMVERALCRLNKLYDTELGEGKISGAIGTYTSISPEIERLALEAMCLRPAKAETQILQRDRHAMVLSALAATAASMQQMALTLHTWCGSEIDEVMEPKKPRDKGSSAMPHKVNPILLEQLIGLPSVIFGYLQAQLSVVATPESRDIRQSGVERIIIPDAFTLLHYIVYRMNNVVKGMTVKTDVMARRVNVDSLGVWATQQVKTALIDAGIDPELAYRHAQSCAFEAVAKGMHMSEILSWMTIGQGSRTAVDLVGREKIASFFDAVAYAMPGIDAVYANFAHDFAHEEEPPPQR